MMNRILFAIVISLITAGTALAQTEPQIQINDSLREVVRLVQVVPVKPQGKSLVDMGLATRKDANPLQIYARGTFWRDPQWISMLSLSTDQQKRMDAIFQQYRLKLIDANAALEKDEVLLTPLIEALPAGDEVKLNAQIDKIADDRAELEKANSKMLVGIFQVLTVDQWNKLRETRGIKKQ